MLFENAASRERRRYKVEAAEMRDLAAGSLCFAQFLKLCHSRRVPWDEVSVVVEQPQDHVQLTMCCGRVQIADSLHSVW